MHCSHPPLPLPSSRFVRNIRKQTLLDTGHSLHITIHIFKTSCAACSLPQPPKPSLKPRHFPQSVLIAMFRCFGAYFTIRASTNKSHYCVNERVLYCIDHNTRITIRNHPKLLTAFLAMPKSPRDACTKFMKAFKVFPAGIHEGNGMAGQIRVCVLTSGPAFTLNKK